MTNANVSIVVAQIGNGNATQMCAYSRAHQDCGLTGWGKDDFRALIENSFKWILVFLLDFFSSESSDKDGSSIPDNLNNLSRREIRNVDFHVSVPVIPGPSSQSSNGCNGIESGEVEHTSIVDSTEGIKLRSLDLCFMFVVYSILIEPVIDG